MKKQLLSVCLPVVLAFTAYSASAATILGFDAGVYSWKSETSGSAGTLDASGLDGTNTVTYFAFEHPIPIVPNVKIQMSDMTVAGAGTDLIDLSHTDSTVYYEILDNFISIDVGLTARAFDGSYNIASTSTAMTDTSYLLYTAAEVIIPISGLSVGMELSKDMGADKNEINDLKIRVRYQVLGGLGLELGQRTVTMNLKENAPTTQDLEFDGTYFAVTYTF